MRCENSESIPKYFGIILKMQNDLNKMDEIVRNFLTYMLISFSFWKLYSDNKIV